MAAEMMRSEEHTSELQSRGHLVCRLLLEKHKGGPSTLSPYHHSPDDCHSRPHSLSSFSMSLPALRSTLFPYTTLFRSIAFYFVDFRSLVCNRQVAVDYT